MNVLNSYLNYRFFDSDFEVGPEINDKEGIFIPAGFDSPKLVQQLWQNIDDPYDKIVNNVTGSGKVEKQETNWEEWKDWLEELKDAIYEDDKAENEIEKAADSSTKTEKVEKKANVNKFFEELRSGGRSSTRASKPKESEEERKKKFDEFKKKMKLETLG